MQNFIRFDWVIKKLLRDKANFVILEGFLTVVLNQEIKILQILYPLIKSKAVIIWDKDYFFETKNDLFTPNLNGRTFMLNTKNEIVLVGSPLFGGQGILAQYEKLVKNGD